MKYMKSRLFEKIITVILIPFVFISIFSRLVYDTLPNVVDLQIYFLLFSVNIIGYVSLKVHIRLGQSQLLGEAKHYGKATKSSNYQ